MEKTADRSQKGLSKEMAASQTSAKKPAKRSSQKSVPSVPSAPTVNSLRSEATPQTESAEQWINRRASAQALRAAQARQVSGRRRFVDPTTCDRDYSENELEFMQAMHNYKQQSGRMFPTWSEILEVLRSLGYRKELSTTVDEAMEHKEDPIEPSRKRKDRSKAVS